MKQKTVYPTLSPLIFGGMLLWAGVVIPGLIITSIGVVFVIYEILKD